MLKLLYRFIICTDCTKYSTACVLFSLHSIMTRIPRLRLSPVLLQGIMLNVGLSSQKPSRSQRTFLHSSTTKLRKEIHIDEEFRIAVNLSIDRFHHSDQKGFSLSSLSPHTHTWCGHRFGQQNGQIIVVCD